MRRSIRAALLALAGALACAAPAARATTFVAMSDETLARAADAIVVASVEDIETVGTVDGAINTLVTLHVEDSWKGSPPRRLVLKQPGGQLAGRGLWIAGSPEFRRGQRSLLFLSAHRDGTARTTALGMGQFLLDTDVASGEAVAERRLREPVVGGSRRHRLPLRELLATVRRETARGSGAAAAPLVEVPPEATAPDAERMTLEAFTLMDSPSGRWREPDLGQPVVYGLDARGDAGIGAAASLAAIDAAMAAWTTVSGASLLLQRGGDQPPAPLLCDGVSQIVFGDPFGEMPNPVSCSGILALGGYCTAPRSDSLEVHGVRYRRITEGNITFNNGFGSCPFWTQDNLAEVATHELGHTIGIGHSSEDDGEASPALKDATMYYRAHFDGRGAALRADDVAAVRAVYPGGEGSPATDDLDGDGVMDVDDNCPGDDPAYGLANPAQTDSDGDGVGDLCDPCPLVPGEPACQQIMVSTLATRLTARGARLDWRGTIALPPGETGGSARVLVVGGTGTVLAAAMPARIGRRASAGTSSRLTYRDASGCSVRLARTRGGVSKVRVRMRKIAAATDGMPVLSANLQIGSHAFTASLSCPPRRGAKQRCRS